MRQPKIDTYRMALRCPNHFLVHRKGETFFIIRFDDFNQHLLSEFWTKAVYCLKKRIYINPTSFVQFNADNRWTMAEH